MNLAPYEGAYPPYPLSPPLVFTPGGRHRGFRPFADRLRALGYDLRSKDRYRRRDEREVRRFQVDEVIWVDGKVGAQAWFAALRDYQP